MNEQLYNFLTVIKMTNLHHQSAVCRSVCAMYRCWISSDLRGMQTIGPTRLKRVKPKWLNANAFHLQVISFQCFTFALKDTSISKDQENVCWSFKIYVLEEKWAKLHLSPMYVIMSSTELTWAFYHHACTSWFHFQISKLSEHLYSVDMSTQPRDSVFIMSPLGCWSAKVISLTHSIITSSVTVGILESLFWNSTHARVSSESKRLVAVFSLFILGDKVCSVL